MRRCLSDTNLAGHKRRYKCGDRMLHIWPPLYHSGRGYYILAANVHFGRGCMVLSCSIIIA
jgi:hypothetical protein